LSQSSARSALALGDSLSLAVSAVGA